MAAFNRMTIWEVDRRLDTLQTFRDLLHEYFSNVEAVSYHDVAPNEKGVEARQKINALLDDVRQSMHSAGYDTSIMYRDPPAIGGRSRNIPLLENIYNLHQLKLSPSLLIDYVEQAIGKYKGGRGKAVRRTLNPFFWLNETIAFVIGIPFRLLVSAGLVGESTLESNSILGLFKSVVVFIGTLITWAVGLLTISEKLGYQNAIKVLIKRWIP